MQNRMLSNPIAAHPLIWIARWTRESGPVAIERAAACGYDMLIVPLRDPAQIEPAAIARACAAAGVRPIASIIHGPDTDPASADPDVSARGEQRLMLALALARDIGATQLGGIPHAAWGRATAPPSAVGRSNAIAVLARVAAAAKRAGIRMTLEALNRFENNLINTAAQAVEFAEATGQDNLLVHLDTFHMLIEESDPCAAIARSAARLGYFEFSESHRGALGAGNVDVPGLARALVAANYQGPVGFEAFSAAILDPALAAQLSVWNATYRDADQVARAARELIVQALVEAASAAAP
jgi:D-psicose/D-tagatose/L-ribulose 3-epimerase